MVNNKRDCILLTDNYEENVMIIDMGDGIYLVNTFDLSHDERDVKSVLVEGLREVVDIVGSDVLLTECSAKTYAKLFPQWLSYNDGKYQAPFFDEMAQLIKKWVVTPEHQLIDDEDDGLDVLSEITMVWEVSFSFKSDSIWCEFYDENDDERTCDIPFDFAKGSPIEKVIQTISERKPSSVTWVDFKSAQDGMTNLEIERTMFVEVNKVNKPGELSFIGQEDIRIHELFKESPTY